MFASKDGHFGTQAFRPPFNMRPAPGFISRRFGIPLFPINTYQGVVRRGKMSRYGNADVETLM
jgi:hypothetical protein